MQKQGTLKEIKPLLLDQPLMQKEIEVALLDMLLMLKEEQLLPQVIINIQKVNLILLIIIILIYI
jgi:hypothetical protein